MEGCGIVSVRNSAKDTRLDGMCDALRDTGLVSNELIPMEYMMISANLGQEIPLYYLPLVKQSAVGTLRDNAQVRVRLSEYIRDLAVGSRGFLSDLH